MFELKIFITLYGGEYITQQMRVLIVYIYGNIEFLAVFPTYAYH